TDPVRDGILHVGRVTGGRRERGGGGDRIGHGHRPYARTLPRMGKASRRKHQTEGTKAPARAPFVNRPFEGLANETDWVAMREIIPAATAKVTMELNGSPQEVTLVSVLPGAMPAI